LAVTRCTAPCCAVLVMIMLSSASNAAAGPDHEGITLSRPDGRGQSSTLDMVIDSQGDKIDLHLPNQHIGKDVSLHLDAPSTDPLYLDTGTSPRDIEMADIDGDGDLDILSANQGEDTISLFLSNGDGTFLPGKKYQTGKRPGMVRAMDVNGDDHPDAISLQTEGNTFTVMINNGNSGFEIGDTYKTGDLPKDMCMGDFDRDGDMDLVLMNRNMRHLEIWTNTVGGQFILRGNLSVGGDLGDIESGDLNGDSVPDILISNRSFETTRTDVSDTGTVLSRGDVLGSLEIYQCDGNGWFTRSFDHDLGFRPDETRLGDIDRDGNLDAVSLSAIRDSATVFYGDGTGSFLRSSEFPLVLAERLFLGDLDNDGYLDILTTAPVEEKVIILFNRGDGTYEYPIQYTAGVNLSVAAMGDLDNDGDGDVAVGCLGTNKIYIAFNRGDGTIADYEQYDVGPAPRGVDMGDLDGDGKPEIVTSNYEGSDVTVLKNIGNGRFGEVRTYGVGTEPYAVNLADFNSDGHLDIVSADEARHFVIILINDGNGDFSKFMNTAEVGGFPFKMDVVDLDRDGHLDILTANNQQGTVSILYGQGDGNFDPFIDLNLGEDNFPFDVCAGDINDDGIIDIASSNLGTPIKPQRDITLVMGKGDRSFGDPVYHEVGLGPTHVEMVDMDGDMDLDLISTGSMDHTVSVLLNDGHGQMTPAGSVETGDQPFSCKPWDMDRDGDFDLVVANTGDNTIAMLENDGNGQLTVAGRIHTGSQPVELCLEDIDGDDRMDLVSSNLGGGKVSIHRSPGPWGVPEGIWIKKDGKEVFSSEGRLPENGLVVDISDYLQDRGDDPDEDGGGITCQLTVGSRSTGHVVISAIITESGDDDNQSSSDGKAVWIAVGLVAVVVPVSIIVLMGKTRTDTPNDTEPVDRRRGGISRRSNRR